MKITSSKKIKFLILVAITLTIFVFWQYGLETAYARFLTGGTNVLLNIVSNNAHIAVEEVNGSHQFRVTVILEEGRRSFPQSFGSLLQPTVIIIAWQIFLFIILKRKPATQALIVNFCVFYALQILFLTFLTGYYESTVMKFIYEMLMDTFYIFAIVLIIKDNLLYSVFNRVIPINNN